MATATPSADESVFNVVTEQIKVVFDRIITEVITRRDQLLSEVNEKRREFELTNSSMVENMIELEDMRSQLEKMSVKQNLAMKKQQESLADIDSEISKLRTDINRNTQVKYSCCLDQLIQQVKQFGEIIDASSNLTLAKPKCSKKLSAVQVIKGVEGGEARPSIKLHVDSYQELLYVTQLMGDTVSVFNANNFKFIQDFGRYSLTPGCVTASKEFIYVLSTINGLYQYTSSDFTFVRKVESSFFQLFTNYIGIAVSEDDQVFIMDDCGSIKLYDRTLILKEKLKLDLKKFREPNRVYSMVMKGNNIFILLTNKILLFVPFGDWKNIGFYFKKEEGNDFTNYRISPNKRPGACCFRGPNLP